VTQLEDVVGRADLVACSNQEDATCGESVYLLQKSATIIKKQSATIAIAHQMVPSSHEFVLHGSDTFTVRTIAAASKLGLFQSRVAMNPFLYRYPFLNGKLNVSETAVPESVVTTMSWYNYILCGVIALNILALLAITWKACSSSEIGEEYEEGEEIELQDDYTIAKYVGLVLATIDANDWMVFTFFPTWCVKRGLSETDAGFIMSMMGIGLVVGAPFVAFLIPRVGGPSITLWYGSRVYALTRILCVSLIFVPLSTLFLISCAVFLITGFTWAINEVAAATWVLVSVTSDKRAGAIGYMVGGRMLGSLLGPGVGGLLFGFGGFGLPFVVGVFALLFILHYGRPFFESLKEQSALEGSAKGCVLRHFPVLLCTIVYLVVMSVFCSQMMWQQIRMLNHYHIHTWEYGVMYTCLLIVMAVFMAAVVAKTDYLIGSIPTILFGLITMGSGYMIIGPSPLLPFLSHSSSWIPIVGSALWAIGIGFPMVILNSFVCNIAIGAGWSEMDASIQLSTIQILLTGAALMLGPPLSAVLIAKLGVGRMCTTVAFSLTCCCGGIMCLLSCVTHNDASRDTLSLSKPVKEERAH